MSELQQSVLISSAILASVLLSQLGTRRFTAHKVLLPLALVAAFGYGYLRSAPTDDPALVVYAVGGSIGALLGVVATAFTRIRRGDEGIVETVCGVGFAATWILTAALRVAFVAAAEHDAGFRAQLGDFMRTHQLMPSVIAPFFVLMALATVLVRLALVGRRIAVLPRTESHIRVEAVPAR